MNFNRPHLKPETLEEFFNGVGAKAESCSKPKERARIRKHAEAALWYLNQGSIRVWNPEKREVNVWVKHAILGFFRTAPSAPLNAGCFEYWDKLPAKRRTSLKDVRVVPGAVVRYGAYLEPGTIVMPGFVNIGAYVGKGSMVDTWATVGSCAQIGSGVHLSGGVGIGGVLEPAQAAPVVIGDGAFIGSRAIIVEGVRVGAGAVIGAGVVLTASTKIIDVRASDEVVTKGEIPERAVVIPGTYQKKFPAGVYGAPCALIIGERSTSTDQKTSLNNALRDFDVPV